MSETARYIARKLGKFFRYLRNIYNTHEKLFEVIGFAIGFILFLVVMVLGIASIPFTGGASLAALIPAWVYALTYLLAGLYFAYTFVNCYIVVGRAIGIALDYFLNDMKAANFLEQMFTIAGFVLGVIVAAVLAGILLKFGAPIIVTLVGVKYCLAPWIVVSIEIPCLIGALTGCNRQLGRMAGRIYEWYKETFSPEDNSTNEYTQIRTSNAEIIELIGKAKIGIEKYIAEKQPQDFFEEYFDSKTGIRRAHICLAMFNYENKIEQRDHKSCLQQAIILLGLLEKLKSFGLLSKMGREMNSIRKEIDQNGVEIDKNQARVKLQKYISENTKVNERKYVESVKTKLGDLANSGMSLFVKEQQGEQKVIKDGYEVKPKYRNRYNDVCVELRMFRP